MNQLSVLERQQIDPVVDQFADIMSSNFSPTEQAYFSTAPDSMQAYLESMLTNNLFFETHSADNGSITSEGVETLVAPSLLVTHLGEGALSATGAVLDFNQAAAAEQQRRVMELFDLFEDDSEDEDDSTSKKDRKKTGFALIA